MHGRLDLRHQVRLFSHFTNVPLVSISDAQREPLRHLLLRWEATVHHGLPVSEIPLVALQALAELVVVVRRHAELLGHPLGLGPIAGHHGDEAGIFGRGGERTRPCPAPRDASGARLFIPDVGARRREPTASRGLPDTRHVISKMM